MGDHFPIPATMECSLELRTRDRARKLIFKIDAAISCLEGRPTATLSLDAQQRHERMEPTHRSD